MPRSWVKLSSAKTVKKKIPSLLLSFIKLRGTKEGQECAYKGHLEIFQMPPGERQRKSSETYKEPKRYKMYWRDRTGAHERNNNTVTCHQFNCNS